MIMLLSISKFILGNIIKRQASYMGILLINLGSTVKI
jgi:hypothetical protein